MTTNKFLLNNILEEMIAYTSKDIAKKVSKMPDVMNLSFGEPEFGPPDFLRTLIEEEGLTWDAFLKSVKGYEQSKGSPELREAIAGWYRQKYNLIIDPECEIMITHGGVEAINLAIQCTTQNKQGVIVTNPSYMLYERVITALDRNPVILDRPMVGSEYHTALDESQSDSILQQAGAIIINSPENPSGYMLDSKDWESVANFTKQHGIWVIHDEVYDVMAYSEQHQPARRIPTLQGNTILINSFSKKFGLPGLRIGWIVADEKFINMASKLHDYFYLGVNKQYEQIATLILKDQRIDRWLNEVVRKLEARMVKAINVLDEDQGYQWLRKPSGAMFLFPDVSNLYMRLPPKWKNNEITIGECVAEYLLQEKGVAVVPGYIYGSNSANNIRLVLCTTDDVFEKALYRLTH